MNMADRHVDGPHRPQRVDAPLQRRLSATALNQENLMQPRMTMGREFPFVQHGARGNGLAMHDVGQVAGLAEQIVGPDRPVRNHLGHVRIVQVFGGSIHLENRRFR